MSFLYMSSEQALAAEMKSMQAVQEGLAEYEELKALLLKRTWRFGTLFAVYLLLTINGEVIISIGLFHASFFSS